MKIFLRLVSALMVCVLLFCCSPIRAEAALAETILFVGIPVIMALIIGIGLKPDTTTGVAFSNVVNDCFDALKATGEWIVDGDKVALRTQMVDGFKQYYVDVQLVEDIREWLFNKGVILTESVSSYGNGVDFLTAYDNSLIEEFWKQADVYNLAASASVGQILLYSSHDTGLVSNTLWGLAKQHSSVYGVDVLTVNSVSAIGPYTSYDLPVGSFLTLGLAFDRTFDGTNCVRTSTASYPYVLFLNRHDALSAYSSGLTPDSFYFYLTEDTYFSLPYYQQARSSYDKTIDAINIGRITPEGDESIISSTLYGEYRSNYSAVASCALYPSNVDTDVDVVPGEGVALGQVATPDEDISTGYQQWANGAILDGDVTYMPVGLSSSFDNISSMTQEQIWSGKVYAASPVISTQDYEYQLSYELGAIPKPLFAKAYSPDDGKLTYQWYVDAFPIAGAQTAVYYPPTTEAGVHTYTCLVGNVTTTEVAASYAWTWPVQVTVAVPGSEVVPTVPPGVHTGEHTFTSTVVKAPTCTSTGINVNTCTICGTVYTETVAALEHTWVLSDAAASVATYECAVCAETKAGYSVSDSIGGMSSMMGDFNDSIGGFINQANRFSVFLAGLIPAFHGDALSLVWLSLSAVVIMAVWRKWFK